MLPTTNVAIAFDLSAAGSGDFFTLNDPVKGELDNTVYKLAGDILTDVTPDVRAVQIRRGRSRELDRFQAGAVNVVLDNRDRDYDPTNSLETGTRLNQAINPSFEVNLSGWFSGSSYFTDGESYRYNLMPNPSFETSTAGWTADATILTTSGATLSQSTDQAYAGSNAGFVQCSASATTEGIAYQIDDLQPNTTYRVSAYVYPEFGYTASLATYDLSASVAGSVSASAPAGSWTRLDSTLTTGSTSLFTLDTSELDDATVFLASGTETSVLLAVTGQEVAGSYFTLDDVTLGELDANVLGPSPGAQFYVDAVMVEETSLLNPYFDGTYTDASLNDAQVAWDGTTNLSTSTLTWIEPTLSQSSAQNLYGAASALVEVETRFADQGIWTTLTGLAASTTFTISIWAYVQQGSSVVLSTRDLTNGVNGSTSSATSSASWVRLSSTVTTGASAADVLIAVYTTSEYLVPGSGPFSTFYVDGLLVEATSSLLPYFDGSTADGSILSPVTSWNGTANASTSNLTYSIPGTGSPYFPSVKPRKAVQVTVDGFPAFYGVIEDWDFNYTPGGDATATVKGADGFPVLARTRIAPLTVPEEDTGARVTRILNLGEVGWDAGRRAIETGQATLAAATTTDYINTLDYLQRVEQAEPGLLFIDAAGDVVFRNRTASQLQPQIVFADDGTGVPFADIAIEYGTEVIRNRAVLKRDGGATITVTATDSITEYGNMEFAINNLLLSNDDQVVELGSWIVQRYAEPVLRIDSVALDLVKLTSEQVQEALLVELGTVARVVFTPGGVGTPIERYVVVDSIVHDITAATHRITFDLSEAVPAFTLDSTEFGVLGTNRLGF